MIPPTQHPAWSKLIKGELCHKFSAAAAGLLFFNLQRQYERDPGGLPERVKEAHAFMTKYERVLADDLQVIFK